jgi:hypothetical protein
MVCAFLRSCYTTTARLIAGRPDIVSPITWYFCDPDAQLLPIPSVVQPLQWLPAEEREGDPIGEIAGAPRFYRTGTMVGRPKGTDYHGDDEWWLNGSPDGMSLARSSSGIPAECNAPLVGEGGLQIGGVHQVEGPIRSPCNATRSADRFRVIFGPPVFSGFPPLIIGTFLLPYSHTEPSGAVEWSIGIPDVVDEPSGAIATDCFVRVRCQNPSGLGWQSLCWVDGVRPVSGVPTRYLLLAVSMTSTGFGDQFDGDGFGGLVLPDNSTVFFSFHLKVTGE